MEARKNESRKIIIVQTRARTSTAIISLAYTQHNSQKGEHDKKYFALKKTTGR
jgi:hypothetical protein